VIFPNLKVVLIKIIDSGFLLLTNCIIYMMELIAIAALVICFAVISFVIRIYKESPKIKRNADSDKVNKLS